MDKKLKDFGMKVKKCEIFFIIYISPSFFFHYNLHFVIYLSAYNKNISSLIFSTLTGFELNSQYLIYLYVGSRTLNIYK